MTKTCKAGHAQGSGNIKALTHFLVLSHCPFTFMYLSFDCLTLYPEQQQPTSFFRVLPAGTLFVGVVQNEIEWISLSLGQSK